MPMILLPRANQLLLLPDLLIQMHLQHALELVDSFPLETRKLRLDELGDGVEFVGRVAGSSFGLRRSAEVRRRCP